MHWLIKLADMLVDAFLFASVVTRAHVSLRLSPHARAGNGPNGTNECLTWSRKRKEGETRKGEKVAAERGKNGAWVEE